MLCSPERTGWNVIATHWRCPTTDPRGQFKLLCVQPDPIPGSSDHLVAMCSHNAAMQTQALVRTPAQHGIPRPVSPVHQQSTTLASR